MYDEWANATVVEESIYLPLDNAGDLEMEVLQSVVRQVATWDDDFIQLRFAEPLTFPTIDDAFIIPAENGFVGLKPKAVGDEDWLRPLYEPTLPGITVPPPPRPPSPGYQPYNPGNPYDPYDPGHDTSQDAYPPAPPPPNTPCELDQSKDSVATTIADEIKKMPDWNEREYGALILRDSHGYIYIGDIARGETVAEAQTRAIAAGQTDFAPETRFGSVPTGFTVIGVVHSHPDVGYDPSEDLENRYPSNYAGGGDYTNFENLVGTDPRFGFGAEFTQYILGPDGVLREFDFTEGRVTASNDTRTNRDDLASDRPCG